MDLEITSLNIYGFERHWINLTKLFRKNTSDVYCMQEVHKIDKSELNERCQKNNFCTYKNCLDKKDIWHDKEQKTSRYYQGTVILIKAEIASKYSIKEETIILNRVQKIRLEGPEGAIEIWNVYGPTKVSKQQIKFYEVLTRNLNSAGNNTIICGDFNIIIESIDAKINCNFDLTAAARIWKNFIDTYNYQDIYRWRKPFKNMYILKLLVSKNEE